MKVIVDTVIWSLALRRDPAPAEVRAELAALIDEQRVVMLGPVRQEVLSGYSDPQAFERLRAKLGAFPNEPLLDVDFERAAEFHNTCRRHGVQGAHTDYLICACAARLDAAVYTRDNDFEHYAELLPIRLHHETAP